MDIVITYVDGLDPLWQKDYESAVGRAPLTKRFRDWGTLKYLLRGIERYMPFIRNVYLVVSRHSQVPAWVNTDNLKTVLHEDIIPSEYLPIFNSAAIEMFLHRIEGLDEEYIYFNDDIFPLSDCKSTDFFVGPEYSIASTKPVENMSGICQSDGHAGYGAVSPDSDNDVDVDVNNEVDNDVDVNVEVDMSDTSDASRCERDVTVKAVNGFSKCWLPIGMFRKHTCNSDFLARKALGTKSMLPFVRPQHSCNAMLRSECEALSNILEKEIRDSISTVREPKNLNQYLFLDYMYYGGKTINRRRSNRHFSLATASLKSITDFILNPDRSFACINDVQMSDEKFETFRKGIVDAFECRLPQKSAYEL